MKNRDETIYLRDILDAITKIEKYLQGVDEEAFYQDSLVQDGVIRQLQVIGEAVKRLPMGLRARYANIPWKNIAGTRDKLIHDYSGIKLGAVWSTTQNDVPALKETVQRMLENLSSSAG